MSKDSFKKKNVHFKKKSSIIMTPNSVEEFEASIRTPPEI
jgi:hypothetical protein